ncbi:spinster family MFS transporter [Parasphingorhabdus sp.]|uniref:spinster family MFS transporter n=1 Tax=Parasphingorhabdus sp. TaxID=2709688 RepID=UPI0035939197
MAATIAASAVTGRKSNPWVVLIVLLFIYIFNYADRYLISGLVDPIKAEFGVGDQFMGLLMGPAFALLYTTIAIPIARLADRSSRIVIICVGCLIWSLFTGLSGAANGPWMLALARLGVGVGEAAFIAPAYSLLSDYFRPEKRGMVFAILGLAVYFGQITGYAAGPAIAEAYSWRMAFYAMAVPGVIISGIAFLIVREPARLQITTKLNQVPLLPLIRRLIKARSYVLMMFGMGLATLSGVGFGFWGPTLFHRVYEVPLTEASTTFGLYFGLAGLSGMLLFGAVSDKLARGGMQRPLLMAGMAMLAASVCILASTWSDTLFVAKMLAIPAGLLGGGWSIGIMQSLQYLVPDRFRATSTALFIMVTTFLGFIIGPWATGALSELFGNNAMSLRWALTIIIPTGMVGGLLTLLGARHLETNRIALAGGE